MLIRLKPLSLKNILKRIPLHITPNLKTENSLFSIDTFFYSYSLIKKLVSKNNLFYSLKENKITRANLKRFSKPLRENLLITEVKIKKIKRIEENRILRKFINEQDFKKL